MSLLYKTMEESSSSEFINEGKDTVVVGAGQRANGCFGLTLITNICGLGQSTRRRAEQFHRDFLAWRSTGKSIGSEAWTPTLH